MSENKSIVIKNNNTFETENIIFNYFRTLLQFNLYIIYIYKSICVYVQQKLQHRRLDRSKNLGKDFNLPGVGEINAKIFLIYI